MGDLFGASPLDIQAQIREVRRELGQRRHVYPRLVQSGKLTEKHADQQMRLMEAVLETLERVANEERVKIGRVPFPAKD